MRVRPNRRPGEVERRVENVLTMFSRVQSIVDDESDHDVARHHFAVGNILAPQPAPAAVALHPFARIRSVGTGMTDSAVCLIGHMIRCGSRDSG
jgi:hypothetical protein